MIIDEHQYDAVGGAGLLIGGGNIENFSDQRSTSTNRILMNRRGVCAIPGGPAMADKRISFESHPSRRSN